MFISCMAFSQTSIEGKVKDDGTGEPVIYAGVTIFKNGVLITGAETDLEGNFMISDIQPGKYDVEVALLGYKTTRLEGVQCNAGQTRRLDITMETEGEILNEIVVKEYRVPLIEVDNTTTGTTITSDKIANLPQKQINAIVANSAGVTTNDDGSISVRGSRSNETVTFIDGIRTTGTIPQSEVEQIQLVTGGVEAKYGDVSGGIVSLTSKGPSKEFTGGVEAETSEFLDGFGYNLLSANLSGPILKKKNGQSVIGFRVSAQYTNIADNNPSILGVYRAPLSVINQIESDAFYNIGTSLIPNAELLRNADINGPLKARPNDDQRNINLTGKLDFKISKNIDLTLSGNYEDDKDRFTPGDSRITNSRSSWAFLNWNNNPYSYDNFKRFNLRFRHKLGKQNDGTSSGDSVRVSTPSLLRNFSYTILAGFERRNELTEDFRHEDNLFNYGYFGSQAINYEPGIIDTTLTVAPGVDIRFVTQGPTRVTAGEFIPNATINPVLAQYENPFNGILRSDRSAIWSNLYANAGQVYNLYQKTEKDLYTFNFSSGLDIIPSSSSKGRHNLQFGIIYEQSVDRSYGLSPFGIWDNINNLANGPLSLSELDSNSIRGYYTENDGKDTLLTIYNPTYEFDSENKFFFKIREKFGVGERDFINSQAILPDQLSLDMFSARELTDPGLLRYRGYDYLGNKTSGSIAFEDFFTAKDEDGRRTFPVAAFSPIYAAGYIQDKFSYKDNIILRIGLRADYYDANTKVFKDPYAIYEIESAEQYYTRVGSEKPEAIGSDYKVYVKGSESNEIIGYRQGDQWFSTNGTAVSGGNLIFNGGVVYPSYVGRFEPKRILDIQDPNFNPDHAFEDYKPQLNLMPRLAFSFPISNDANFFAHYDVLYQRPPSNSTLSALDYFYFNNAGQSGVQDNPNLRPIRTVSYEAGFQQKISNFSALKISAYYKENKDLIQRRVYSNIPAPISQYETYGNLDYGTIKGFSFQFDRRRVNNLEITATYTLQFADGSGSDANSSGGINQRGIIRTLNPLSYDERHRFTANADYRYESGKKYDGPKIAGIDIFANAGINLNAIVISGQPFTRNAVPTQFDGTGFLGSINGSRLPWNFTLDGRIDKKIDVIKLGKITMEGVVYLRVQNILNTQNVKNVYGYTGDPDNDGYLTSEFGLDRINDIRNTGKNEQAFIEAYNWRLLNGGNYFLPRRMYLGVMFNF